jgi:hypothetical protein
MDDLAILANYNPARDNAETQRIQQQNAAFPVEARQRQAMNEQAIQAEQLKNQRDQQAIKDAAAVRDAILNTNWDMSNPGASMSEFRTRMAKSPISGPGFVKGQSDVMEMVKQWQGMTDEQHKQEAFTQEQSGLALSAAANAPAEKKQDAWTNTVMPRWNQLHPREPLPAMYPGDDAVQQLLDRNNFTGKLLAQRKTTVETKQAEAATAKAEQETSIGQRKSDAQLLASAARRGPDALAAAINGLPYGRAKVFEGATKPEDFLQLAMTAEQGIQTAETARHNLATEKTAAGNLAEERRHNAQQENLKRLEVDPFGMLGKGAGSAGAANTGAGGPTGEAFLQTMPKALADQVKALAEGRMAFPAGFALKSPYWQAMISRVAQYDPSFDAVNYNARSKTRNAFTAGKEAQSVNALNTAIGHLGEMADAGEALHQGNMPLVNGFVNKMATAFGDPAMTNFNAVRDRVVDEVTRLYRGTGGAEADIKRGLENFTASASPAQRKGAIAETIHLMQSKMDALEDQYKQGMGTTSQGLSLLNPKAKATIQKLEKPSPPTSAYKVGDKVNYQGKEHTVTAIKPDGKLVLD